MGMIVDSCVFIAAERNRLDLASFVDANDPDIHLTSVIWSELLQGVHRANSDSVRVRRESYVRGLALRFPIEGFSMAEADVHSAIVAMLESQGQNIGAYDSMIAATALAHDWSVATLNLADFQRIPGLKIVDATPWLVK
jgi:tRNA(fMet)-specific endonuclease VapC